MTRSRTSFLVSARNAALISFSRPSNAAQLLRGQRLDLVGLALALLLARDGQHPGQLVGDLRGHGVVDVRLVVHEHRELGVGLAAWSATRCWASQSTLRNGLAASRPSGTVSSVGATAPLEESASIPMVPVVDSASTIMIATSPSGSIRPATTMSKVASFSCSWVGNADPLALDQGDPHAADRPRERQPEPAWWTGTPR